MRAILASDIHLQQTAPLARSAEPDWYAAMARPLGQLRDLADKLDVPVVYAGDIFDKWNPSAELINFALRHLPRGYAVPGQHDLPNHSYKEIRRSGYWTLCEAGVLHNLEPGELVQIAPGITEHLGGTVTNTPGVYAVGFPWDQPVAPLPDNMADGLYLAVVHAYCYNSKHTSYPGAPPQARASVARSALQGFDAAAYGDNHKGFIDHRKGLTICNCGGFMRRKTDEVGYRPGVGLLLGDGRVARHYLDTSEDQFIELTDAEAAVGKVLDMGDFVDGLDGLGADGNLDFVEALGRTLTNNKTDKAVREIVMAAATT